MAQKTLILFTDDLDGTEAEGTVSFGLDGGSYEIDLSAGNAGKLRATLAQYIEVARRVHPGARARVRAGRARASRENTQEIREWAKKKGYDVSDRGRIPANIIMAFNAASTGPVADATTPPALAQLAPRFSDGEEAGVRSGPAKARGGRKPAVAAPEPPRTRPSRTKRVTA